LNIKKGGPERSKRRRRKDKRKPNLLLWARSELETYVRRSGKAECLVSEKPINVQHQCGEEKRKGGGRNFSSKTVEKENPTRIKKRPGRRTRKDSVCTTLLSQNLKPRKESGSEITKACMYETGQNQGKGRTR